MKIIPLDHLQFPQLDTINRGISTFTSFISDHLDFIFLNDHIERLLQGAHYLFPKHQWPNKKDEINRFLLKEFLPEHYFRLTIVEDMIFFSKKMHTPQASSLAISNGKSLKSPSLLPAYLKNSNYLLAQLELNMAREKNFDDVIFFDHEEHVTEASTSNIFVVVNKMTIVTPRLTSMVLAGVTRKNLMNCLRQEHYQVWEKDVSKSDLENALEIWLTNSVQGIRVVNCYEERVFSEEMKIYQKVCERFGRFGEKFKNG